MNSCLAPSCRLGWNYTNGKRDFPPVTRGCKAAKAGFYLLRTGGPNARHSARHSHVPDPQEAQLGAKVWAVSDVREEVFCMTGSAGRHARSIRHRVVVDVTRQDAASFQQNSDVGDVSGSVHAFIVLGSEM